jgi:hypothetical protein
MEEGRNEGQRVYEETGAEDESDFLPLLPFELRRPESLLSFPSLPSYSLSASPSLPVLSCLRLPP